MVIKLFGAGKTRILLLWSWFCCTSMWVFESASGCHPMRSSLYVILIECTKMIWAWQKFFQRWCRLERLWRIQLMLVWVLWCPEFPTLHRARWPVQALTPGSFVRCWGRLSRCVQANAQCSWNCCHAILFTLDHWETACSCECASACAQCVKCLVLYARCAAY